MLPDSLLAELFRQQGKAYNSLDQPDHAIAVMLQGYRLLKNKGRSEVLGKLSFNLGILYYWKQELPNAVFYYTQAAENLSESGLRSTALKYAADVCFSIGDYEKGITLAQRSIEAIDPDIYPLEAAEAYNALGFNQYTLERFHEAAQAFTLAQQYYYSWTKNTGQENPEIIAAIICNDGLNSLRLQKSTEAIGQFKKVSNIYRTQKDTDKLIRYGLSNAGIAYLMAGDTLMAVKRYQQAIDLIEKHFPQAKNSKYAIIYSNMAMRLGYQHAAAIPTFKKALSVFPRFRSVQEKDLSQIPYKYDLQEIIHDYGKVVFQAGKNRKDLKTVRDALIIFEYNDRLIDYMRREHSSNVSKLFWRKKTRDMYERAIEACYLLNDPVKAFYFFEKSRAVLLNDQLNELSARQQLSPAAKEKERSLFSRIADLQNKLGDTSPGSAENKKLLSQLAAARYEQDIFISSLEQTLPQYYAYKYDNHVPSIPQVRQNILAKNQTFICYFMGEEAVYGLAVTAKNLIFRKINVDTYRKYSTVFRRLLADRETQNKAFPHYLAISSRLYQLLIQPFGFPQNTRVIISSDGHFLPFEALSTSASHPAFLVNDHAFSYTYSAGFLQKIRRKAEGFLPGKSYLGLAPVEFSPLLKQATLPGSDISLAKINKQFWFSKIVTGTEASRETFVNESPAYRIVQLLTHATADSTGSVPKLYFADSTLSLPELTATRDYFTQLLVLSACRTGIGQDQQGEGVFSLARGFAALGIPSTLTTLWRVENQSVYDLTERFYEYLNKGLPLDVALQQAQIHWLKSASSGNRLPYAWAGIVLVGNTEPVIRGSGFWWAIFGILGAMVILAWWAGRRFLVGSGLSKS
ncbi:hypothetical protein DYBT9275_02483 [Dyadobacter sp. CECT 9275]|uniref:CHAT domain-containing protein n=2 Tax=Dyadobacter helix TaxID=2822344 RepID=A0A916JE78_9BACT|nr:hypothetical protein DYBT9275_02483 [Dyadobacter sp. CECT 9275]